jgi:hypothetical protein
LKLREKEPLLVEAAFLLEVICRKEADAGPVKER